MTGKLQRVPSVAAEDNGPRLEVHNPANGLVVGTVPNLSADDVAKMAAELRAAQPEWEELGPHGRARHLLNWLDWVVDNEDHLFGLVHREAGKSWGDAALELMVCMEMINFVTKNGAAFVKDESRRIHGPASFNKRLLVHRKPYQLVGVITPWNYPLGMPMMDVPGALMAGAAVLSKPSEVTPLAWAEAVRAWNEEIGAPRVLGCATGAGDTGRAVVEEVDYIQFTGSTKTGRAIGVRAAERLIPASLELGGKDAMVVFDDADVDRAVAGAVWGGFFNAGQSCIAVERVYVQDGLYQQFVDKLVAEVEKLRVGHDAQGEFSADYGAMATDNQMAIVEGQVADARDKGARVLTGGKRSERGLFYPPTVLVDVDHTMSCMRDETFGPLLPVMRFSTADEAIDLANDSPYGLSGSVWTASVERGRQLGNRIDTGGMNVNNALANVFQIPLPMGGWKQSGLGHRFGGPNMVQKYMKQQAMVTERLRLKGEIYWYPYVLKKSRAVDRVLRLTGLHDWRRRLGRAPKPSS
ncbi:aldehyde dehydrogenase [Mycolicibacterium fortuitum]|uniref:Aldehyde dehydrogenase n=1 Tax=Mycolicibacterium fortuitum TaxID=1766 RepID=A0ABD6QE41_MYCFO|nr:aldehyde dehydrogenase family protein [Mycolicibacterium fortuitum]OMC33149.1 aldehyde dehydrogenase [Mycolicibacterium fortuitum]